ncbi:MAG: methylenetetrahydrofolate reductase [Fibrobacterota bacterium]
MKSDGNLERVLAAGHFAITAELGPPKGNSVEAVRKKTALLKGNADAVNITDNQTAVVRMSSAAASALCVREGLEPVMQMVARDRNRIAMQSDILGATALGVRNLLCLSGDHACFGTQPCSKSVFDIDSIQMIQMVKRMRDEKRLLDSDEALDGDVKIFIGAAANPFAEPLEFRALHFKKKVDAGADFAQTQVIYDMDIFKRWMVQVRNLGLHERCKILAGVIPLKSFKMAQYMANNVSGVIIPDALLTRMEAAPKGKGGEEGIKICLEQIEQLRAIEGVSGVHLMAIEWEHKVPEIVERDGLLPRPVLVLGRTGVRTEKGNRRDAESAGAATESSGTSSRCMAGVLLSGGRVPVRFL